jgi:hypothetical protein
LRDEGLVLTLLLGVNLEMALINGIIIQFNFIFIYELYSTARGEVQSRHKYETTTKTNTWSRKR